eukprot:TRINITY_DN5469_c0_g2_i3.p1 TRINITY_DN5469_c0_g2~~TRINITY_DN5469_c0_g2_i3.p1  ORF type:complete len:117 (+),score=14.53 TRINITY_DN5469_c0_g2_i3:107-457(+)
MNNKKLVKRSFNFDIDTDSIQSILQLVGIFSSALFSGASWYVSLVQQPALKHLEPGLIVREFKLFYPAAAKLQGSLAFIGSLSFFGSYLLNRTKLYSAVSGSLLFTVLPYTLWLLN